jgi:hypothetical protein
MPLRAMDPRAALAGAGSWMENHTGAGLVQSAPHTKGACGCVRQLIKFNGLLSASSEASLREIWSGPPATQTGSLSPCGLGGNILLFA